MLHLLLRDARCRPKSSLDAVPELQEQVPRGMHSQVVQLKQQE